MHNTQRARKACCLELRPERIGLVHSPRFALKSQPEVLIVRAIFISLSLYIYVRRHSVRSIRRLPGRQ